MPLDLTSFAIKWQQTELSEKSAYQQHFRDLCEALGVPHPTQEDVTDATYCFEKRVEKVGKGGTGFADVWKRDAFACEYKKPGGDLNAAYRQLIDYHEPLENPPLLIVCDFKRFEVHTKFENQPSRVYAFNLEELRLNREIPTSALLPQEVLRHVFGDRNKLRPNAVTERVTRDAATDLLRLARQLELERAADPNPPSKEKIAHFLLRIVFCLFADSIGLIPNNIFRNLVVSSRESRINFNKKLSQLFAAMSTEGSFFGADDIPWFNGGLFRGPEIIELNNADCDILRQAAKRDWSQIEPSIFGTLFERSLDAAKRSMIGAHYTSPEDILLLVEPVVMVPLRRQWESTRAAVLEALKSEDGQPQRRALRANRPANLLLTEWASELTKVRILDPACGSGNFLYIAMKQLLDLWQKAREFALKNGLNLPVESMPTPAQLFGIEIDFYAHEIASAVVWIGLLQWKRDNGYNDQPKPILEKLDNIQHDDAIMRYDAEGKAYEPEWPQVQYIVSNPPFVGGTQMRKQLGDRYCDDLRRLYDSRVKGAADLVAYWFEKARVLSAVSPLIRVGLLSTQGIRGGANQLTLRKVLETGKIFWAISDRNWSLDGATVHVSMVAFTSGEVNDVFLDNRLVPAISADLSTGANTTLARPLVENQHICFEGTKKHGSFDISERVARKMLDAPLNPNQRPNSDVVTPWINALDITRRPRHMFIIDFGTSMTEAEAALYEYPFQYLKEHVYADRQENRREARKNRWWLHGETNPGMRKALKTLSRFVGTPRVSKHRLFSWLDEGTLPDSATCVFARSDDYFFGILHSAAHETWARKLGTQLREAESGFRYTPKTTFDTFPFPWPPGKEPSEADDPRVKAIAGTARELVRLRDNWLNPPGASDDDLKTRTLTKLYNARPEWLANAHRALDEAVFAAYGWPADLPEQEILARLLALNHERATNNEAK